MNDIEALAAIHPSGSLAKLLAKWQREAVDAAAAIPRQEGRIDRAKRCIRALELIAECVRAGHVEAAISLAFSVPEAGAVIPYDGTLGYLSALLPPEGRTDRARRITGKNRAKAKHGDRSEEAKDWQVAMNRICKTKGVTRSRAWAELETETGSKRETMEKYGVICPIKARRGPKRTTP